MQVNGFQLPGAFVQLYRAICEGELDSMWRHRNDIDAYGRPWGAHDLTIVPDLEMIKEETTDQFRVFHQESRFQQDARADGNEPGFIPDFTDVSKLVWIARTGSGEPYCFDFGENAGEPSVVHWDSYWRRVAPNFEKFIALFQPADEAEPYEPSEEEWEEATSIPQTPFDLLLPVYLRGTEEERQELETELRQQAQSRELNEGERRMVDELLKRLRASLAS